MSYQEVQALFRMSRPPAGLLAHLISYDDEDGIPIYYTIRLYRDNFDKLTQMDRHATADWLQKTIGNISVVTDCYLEVWKRPGLQGDNQSVRAD